jgi:tetratricopeptide (TPR) repeat protein
MGMHNSSLLKLTGAVLAAALFVAPAHFSAMAQTGDGKRPAPTLPEAAPPQPEADADAPKASKIPETIPDSAVERAKMLDNLYALLATAEDEQAAEQTSAAITRIWSVSGSDTVTVLMARALKAAQEKNTELALRMLDGVVEQAPDYAEGWSQRAHLLYAEGNVERAVGDLRRALALDPNNFRALSALGHILREAGEKKGALVAYKKLLEVHPFAQGAQQAVEELDREVSGRGI